MTTIKEFVESKLSDAESKYNQEATTLQRLIDRKNGHMLYLSDSLYDRLIKEGDVIRSRSTIFLMPDVDTNSIFYKRILVLRARHEEVDMDLVLDVFSNYPIGYDTDELRDDDRRQE